MRPPCATHGLFGCDCPDDDEDYCRRVWNDIQHEIEYGLGTSDLSLTEDEIEYVRHERGEDADR